MPHSVTNITKPFQNPSELLEFLFNARRQPKRLAIILNRMEKDISIIDRFNERDIVHLILMSLAEQSDDPEVSNEELHSFIENLHLTCPP